MIETTLKKVQSFNCCVFGPKLGYTYTSYVICYSPSLVNSQKQPPVKSNLNKKYMHQNKYKIGSNTKKQTKKTRRLSDELHTF